MKLGIRIGFAAMAALAAVGCSPLTAFNALVPKDGDTIRSGAGIAYGTDPRQRLDI